MDEAACNYDADVNMDDGSCEYAEENYDCDGNCTAEIDCAGECGGSAVEDECGVCNGDGIPDGACDCMGNIEDCAGECGGSAENCPDWEDCPGCYEYTASMTAVVHHTLTGEQLDDPTDVLAAFDSDGNVRGIAVSLFAPFGPYVGSNLWEIQIRSNAGGDAISFKYYDASEDEVLTVSQGYTFVINEVTGNVNNPHELSAGAVTLSIDIGEGWNWISLNVEGEDMSTDSVLASLSSSEGDFLKTPNGTSEYYPDYGWYGSIGALDVTGMYMLKSTNADILTFSGAPVDPGSTPIELGEGWNWIGFTPQNDGFTNDALAGITTDAGDFLKTTDGTSEYYPDYGWYGSLESMAPTQGYMLKVGTASTLIYPNFGPDDYVSDELSREDMPPAITDWVADYHDYEFSGNITMSIGNRTDSEGDYIAAFVGNECRGVAERMYFPFGDSYMYSIMVYSNVAEGEELRFKYYDSVMGDVVEYTETIDFTSDMIVGNGFNTSSLSREAKIAPEEYSLSDAYPNPFNPTTTLSFSVPTEGVISLNIYDMTGRLVSTLVDGNLKQGYHSITWNGMDSNGHAVSSGMYIYSLKGEGISITKKMVMMK